MGAQLRHLGDDRDIYIDQIAFLRVHQVKYMLKQIATGGTGELGIGIGKMQAYIPGTQCAQNSIAQRMQNYVAIGVREQAHLIWQRHTRQD